jgi:hypothetical protein
VPQGTGPLFSWLSGLKGRHTFRVFESDANNLIDNDNNNATDIFRKDMLTGAVVRVSTSIEGIEANDDSANATVSRDGRFVLFASQASNLGAANTRRQYSLFLKDIDSGSIQRVFSKSDGRELETETNYFSNLSGDGKHAVVSYASGDSREQDRNGLQDIYSLDLNAVPSKTIVDNAGHGFQIDTLGLFVGSVIQGPSNAFDSYNRLTVAGELYSADTPSQSTNNGHLLVTPKRTISGLDVRRQAYVPDSGQTSFVRIIDEFSNPTSAPIQVSISNTGNLGSDKQTIVFASSDGDTIAEPTDAWFATDDSNPNGGTPAIVHYQHSDVGVSPSATALVADNLKISYALTVPAGTTSRVASFVLVGVNRSEVLAAAARIENAGILTDDAAKYLTKEELDSIVNFPNGTLSLTLDKQTVKENSGASAASLTIKRTGKSNLEPLTVLVQTSDATEANVQSAATIPAGLDSVTISVDAIDDTLLDGMQVVSFQAFAAGFQSGVAQLAVSDVENITLQVNATSIEEKAGTATATVRRLNTDVGSSVEVQLEVGTVQSLVLPSSVVIPAGEQFVSFSIYSVDNVLFDGDRTVAITANSIGYLSDSTSLTILDNESRKPGTNPVQPLDVNNDSRIDPLDVLNIVNLLNSDVNPVPILGNGNFYDVDGDLATTPLDVLKLVNYLNGFGGEGESAGQPFFRSLAKQDDVNVKHWLSADGLAFRDDDVLDAFVISTIDAPIRTSMSQLARETRLRRVANATSSTRFNK